ncbi:MAG: hypothetical protein AAGC92_01675 [Pseudomonadota bacterium]
MRVHFLGGPQMAKLQAMLRRSLPASASRFSDHSARLADFEAAGLQTAIERADIVVVELSALGDPGQRRARLAALCDAEIIALPEIRLDGLASLELEASADGAVLHGLDPLMPVLSGEDDRGVVLERFVRGEIDMQQGARLNRSLAAMRALEEQHCDLTLVGVIEALLQETPVLYGVTAPTQTVLFRCFERLCDDLGIDPDPTMCWDPVFTASLALSPGLRTFTPWDVRAHRLTYEADTHWYPKAAKLINRAWALVHSGQDHADGALSPIALYA